MPSVEQHVLEGQCSLEEPLKGHQNFDPEDLALVELEDSPVVLEIYIFHKCLPIVALTIVNCSAGVIMVPSPRFNEEYVMTSAQRTLRFMSSVGTRTKIVLPTIDMYQMLTLHAAYEIFVSIVIKTHRAYEIIRVT